MDKESHRARYELALKISEQASLFLLENEKLGREISSKAENDYVTLADQECERLIEESILAVFPDDTIFGEENKVKGNSKGRWIIDPIDGTVNFFNGFPNYSISIAFEDEEGLAIGVVSVVRQKETFHAMRGEGAFLNGKPIRTNEELDTMKTVAILVPPHRHHELIDAYMLKMRKFYNHFSDMRSIGSAACSLCYVACGRVAVYYEEYLAIYDMAAGVVILSEAGGKYSYDKKSDYWINLLAGSKRAHDVSWGIVND